MKWKVSINVSFCVHPPVGSSDIPLNSQVVDPGTKFAHNLFRHSSTDQTHAFQAAYSTKPKWALIFKQEAKHYSTLEI